MQVKIIIFIYLLILYFFCAWALKAEPPEDSEFVRPPQFTALEFNNDFFAPGGKDRWLTNQIRLSFPIKGNYYVWTIGNDMYTPTDKSNPNIPVGDRPWDGYTFIEYKKREFVDGNLNQFQQFAVRAGILGDASGTDSLQRFIHNDLGLGVDPLGWGTQNASEAALELLYSRKTFSLFDTFFGSTINTSAYGFRAGNVVTEGFMRQELTREYFGFLMPYGGVEGRLVLFNTHLDGRLFHDDVYTVDKEWFVATAWLGLAVRIKEIYIGYKYQYQTREFKEQSGRHLFGTITIGYEF